MGDRFYAQQKAYKPKRKLKKDVIAELIAELSGREVSGLDRLTIDSLEQLIVAVKRVRIEEHDYD